MLPQEESSSTVSPKEDWKDIKSVRVRDLQFLISITLCHSIPVSLVWGLSKLALPSSVIIVFSYLNDPALFYQQQNTTNTSIYLYLYLSISISISVCIYILSFFPFHQKGLFPCLIKGKQINLQLSFQVRGSYYRSRRKANK